MIEMKNFGSYEELRKALYALKLFGISAQGYYGGEHKDNSDIKINGVGAELSKEEYKQVLLERAEKLALYKQEEIQIKKEALKKVPFWVDRASKLMDPDKLSKFLDYIMKSVDSEYYGQDVEDALDIVDFLKGNTGDNYDVLQKMKTKKTPYLVLANLINEYFIFGFYTSMEAVRGMQYTK